MTTAAPSRSVCLVSLGCAKNLVDSEVMVGHLGRAGAPKRWLEPIAPVVDRREFRLALPGGTDTDADIGNWDPD